MFAVKLIYCAAIAPQFKPTWSTVAWMLRVSVVVMVCRAIGCSLPIFTGPTCNCSKTEFQQL